mgnify:CR=1 FL=1
MPSLKKKLVKKKVVSKIPSEKILAKKNLKNISNSENKSNKASNAIELIQKENETQLKILVTKEYDKEIASKASNYIKSYSKIDDAIIAIDDFLNYIENLDEDLFKLFKAYSSSSETEVSISNSNEDVEEEEKPSGVKSDDPVRMYLKEMGNVELLSREGEIAIAKRIESGLDKMMNSILECPASIDILKKWISEVKNN